MKGKLKTIMAEILDVDESDINDDFNPDSTDNWDSLRNLQIITELENQFEINLTMSEIYTMINFSEILKVISAHLE